MQGEMRFARGRRATHVRFFHWGKLRPNRNDGTQIFDLCVQRFETRWAWQPADRMFAGHTGCKPMFRCCRGACAKRLITKLDVRQGERRNNFRKALA